MGNLKLTEIADRIHAHLQRFANDKKVNSFTPEQVALCPSLKGLRPYYNPNAVRSGRYVWITYISYQGGVSLTKGEALRYLEALDNGFIGRHSSLKI